MIWFNKGFGFWNKINKKKAYFVRVIKNDRKGSLRLALMKYYQLDLLEFIKNKHNQR